MQLKYALFYVFKNKRWLLKLAEIALLILLCGIPFAGLIALCALLGWLTEIVHNVSRGQLRPLPDWDHLGEKVSRGLPLLLAVLVYNLPPLILLCLLAALNPLLGASLFGGIAFVGIVAGLLPLLCIYALLAWTMLAVGLLRYGESGDRGEFYRFGKLFRSVQTNAGLSLQWALYSTAANIVLIMLIPAALLGLVLYFPAHGYLIGVYGRRLRAAETAYRQGLR